MKEFIDIIEEYADELLECGHEMCSMSESTNEEIYGKYLKKMVLDYRKESEKLDYSFMEGMPNGE